MSGSVYFIACSEPKSIKIGYTEGHPMQRLKQLQTGCPVPLILIGWYPADRSEESELHAKLSDHRLSGEWFKVCDEINDALIGPFKIMHINNILTGHTP